MSKESNNNKSGITFLGLLTIAWIVLKLTNYISWSWIWVLSPIWGPLVFKGVVIVVAFFLDARGKRLAKEQGNLPLKSKWQQRMDDMHALKEKQNHKK